MPHATQDLGGCGQHGSSREIFGTRQNRHPAGHALVEIEWARLLRPGEGLWRNQFHRPGAAAGQRFDRDQRQRPRRGGGVAGENITVHRVPLADIGEFIESARTRGLGIDVRLLMLLAPGILP